MSKHFSSSYFISFANISLPKASHMAKTRVRWEEILAIFAKEISHEHLFSPLFSLPLDLFSQPRGLQLYVLSVCFCHL